MGLDVGANDYVTKPFSVAELLARVRAALRARAAASSDPPHRLLHAGAIELDRDSRRVAVAEEPVELTAREFEVLEYLMLRPERVLTREQILAAVWDQAYERNRSHCRQRGLLAAAEARRAPAPPSASPDRPQRRLPVGAVGAGPFRRIGSPLAIPAPVTRPRDNRLTCRLT